MKTLVSDARNDDDARRERTCSPSEAIMLLFTRSPSGLLNMKRRCGATPSNRQHLRTFHRAANRVGTTTTGRGHMRRTHKLVDLAGKHWERRKAWLIERGRPSWLPLGLRIGHGVRSEEVSYKEGTWD